MKKSLVISQNMYYSFNIYFRHLVFFTLKNILFPLFIQMQSHLWRWLVSLLLPVVLFVLEPVMRMLQQQFFKFWWKRPKVVIWRYVSSSRLVFTNLLNTNLRFFSPNSIIIWFDFFFKTEKKTLLDPKKKKCSLL